MCEKGRQCVRKAGGVGERQAVWEKGRQCGRNAGGVGESQAVWEKGRQCGRKAGGVGERQAVWDLRLFKYQYFFCIVLLLVRAWHLIVVRISLLSASRCCLLRM